MGRKPKINPTIDPGSVYDEVLTDQQWEKICEFARISTGAGRDQVENALATFAETHTTPAMVDVERVASELHKALMTAHKACETPEGRAVLEQARLDPQRLNAWLHDLVVLTEAARRFAADESAQGFAPLAELVRNLAGAFEIATGNRPSGVNSDIDRNTGSGPDFSRFILACYTTSSYRPLTDLTFLRNAGTAFRAA